MYNEHNRLREFGRCRLDLDNRFLWHDDTPVDLPPKALGLLSLLIENEGSVVTKSEIWRVVWDNAFVEETNLTHHIYLLRKTFRDLGEPDPIKTVPRRGYRFTATKPAHSFVVERHAITQTVVEEISASSSATDARTALPLTRLFRAKALAVAAGFAAVLGAGYWALTVEQRSGDAQRIRILAVLPFVSLNSSSKDDGIGMADGLITRLSAIRSLKVRPTSSVVSLSDLDSVKAGRYLGVDAVLEGTLDKNDIRVRASTRLISLNDGAVIWADQFERPIGRESSLEHEIASRVASLLSADLSAAERGSVTKTYTTNTDAWREYSMARVEWSKRSWHGALEAQRHFRNAMALDPDFALAYSGLADTLAHGSDRATVDGLIDKALEIDPYLAEAHASKGFVEMFRNWNWEAAEWSLLRSIELNPNYATAHHWHAELLAIRGQNDEAKTAMAKALEINPQSPNFLADLGQIHYFAREYKEAEAYCLKALEIDPDFLFAHEYLHDIYLITGDYEKAVAAELTAQRLNHPLPNASARQQEYLNAEREKQLAAFRTDGIAGFQRVLVGGAEGPLAAPRLAFLGEWDRAIDNLERGFKSRDLFTVFARADPQFDILREEPRFQNLLQKLRLD